MDGVQPWRLDEILRHGLIKMTSTYPVSNEKTQLNLKAYYCSGDPSLIFHTKKPTPFAKPKINSSNGKITVRPQLTDLPAYVCFRDSVSQEVKRVWCEMGSVSFTAPLDSKVQITLEAKNKIPTTYEKYTWTVNPPQGDLNVESLYQLNVTYDQSTRLITISAKVLTSEKRVRIMVTNINKGISRNLVYERNPDPHLYNTTCSMNGEENGIYSISLFVSDSLKQSVNIIVN